MDGVTVPDAIVAQGNFQAFRLDQVLPPLHEYFDIVDIISDASTVLRKLSQREFLLKYRP